LLAIIILFLCPAAFAVGTDKTDNSSIRDLNNNQRKVIIIYNDDAAMRVTTSRIIKNAAPVQANSLLKNSAAGNDKNSVTIQANSMDYDNVRDVYHAKGK